MNNQETLIQHIRTVFGPNTYPGDQWLQGSREGCEPYEEVGPFVGKRDWQSIEPGFLDAHAGALHFFSEAGLRFFLPAYLIADVQGHLHVADPVCHLTSGFVDVEIAVPATEGTLLLRTGKSTLINPRRYGALTFADYARYRLAIFTRQEAGAIVAYLLYKSDTASDTGIQQDIHAALHALWTERAATAPLAEQLQRHLVEQEAFLAAAHRRGSST